jgi:hypothetical protein
MSIIYHNTKKKHRSGNLQNSYYIEYNQDQLKYGGVFLSNNRSLHI